MKVLLLEDDNILAESMKLLLESEGFEVDLVATEEEVYDKTFNNKYDLYLLDINIPSGNGIEILKALRDAEDYTPAIFITALTDIQTIKKAFNAGAEDFVKKPFDIEELLIRVKSKFNNFLIFKDIKYDLSSNNVYKDGELIHLSPTLKNILKELLLKRNKPVSKDKLMQYMEKDSENALRVNISKLKSKLNVKIKSIRNEGYLLE